MERCTTGRKCIAAEEHMLMTTRLVHFVSSLNLADNTAATDHKNTAAAIGLCSTVTAGHKWAIHSSSRSCSWCLRLPGPTSSCPECCSTFLKI